MSTLIDELMRNTKNHPVYAEFGHFWHIARPMQIFNVRERIRDAWRVLVGRGRVYHYRADEGRFRRSR